MSTCSVMSTWRNSKASSRMCSMFCSEPVSRLSMQITRCPLPSRCSQRWEPRKPAPPVMTQVAMGGGSYRGAVRGRNKQQSSQIARFSPDHPSRRGESPAPSLALHAMFERRSRTVQGNLATAGRKRAAIELIAREDPELRQAARRYSLCEEDAEDAYQRALEILLVKAPSERPRELIRWMKTVVKHEALAIRGNRERLLGVGTDAEDDPVARLVAVSAGPGERLERRERVARSREALQALKPAELRALTLLAAGYSYVEIGRQTGYSQTKVNRCIAEGRERFRSLLTSSESGGRCTVPAPLLSAYCDGEASAEDAAAVREHLRACAACRAAMRAYRATPAAVAR